MGCSFQLKWSVATFFGPCTACPHAPVCEFLLAGLVTDTGRFRHANASSFTTASMLIERGGLDYQHFIQQMEDTTMTPSDRGADLRGLQRADTTEAGPWTVPGEPPPVRSKARSHPC